MTTVREAKPSPSDEPLMGMPEPESKPPEPSAGELVRAWCSAWSANHQGDQPHGSVVRRVAGICRNVAKDCDGIEEWRAAWYAARDAGAAGQYDVVRFLAAPAPAGRGNHYLALVREPGEAAQGGLLGAMLAQSGGEGPAAIGGAS